MISASRKVFAAATATTRVFVRCWAGSPRRGSSMAWRLPITGSNRNCKSPVVCPKRWPMPPTDHARPPRANVLGVGVSAINMAEALRLSERLLRERGKGYVCLTGVHGIMEAQRDDALRAILNRSFLCAPDGMPTVWVGRLQGHRTHAPRLRSRLHAGNVQDDSEGRVPPLSLWRKTRSRGAA